MQPAYSAQLEVDSTDLVEQDDQVDSGSTPSVLRSKLPKVVVQAEEQTPGPCADQTPLEGWAEEATQQQAKAKHH